MEAQIRQGGTKRETAHIVIHLDDVKYKITQDDNNSLLITKSDFNGNEMLSITPLGSNQINIK